jgi:alpha-galactosidase
MIRKLAAVLALTAAAIATTTVPAQARPVQAAAMAAVPPAGFNPYYAFGDNYSQDMILQQAKAMVSTGLAAAGYTNVVIDDGWMAPQRTASGALAWNPSKFPDGIPWLAGQLHAMGLDLGLYESAGTITCQHLPGSMGHYAQDAQTFASWSVDFVKLDSCGWPAGTTLANRISDYAQFGQDLAATGRPVTYTQELPLGVGNSGGGGWAIPSTNWVTAVKASSVSANAWRVAWDENPYSSAPATYLGHLAGDLHLHGFAGPGHWNDLDMLVTGDQFIYGPAQPSASPVSPASPAAVPVQWTWAQQLAQISIWAMEASPMIVSTDVTRLSAQAIAALTNPHMLAIDRSGEQAPTQITDGPIWALVKPDPEGGRAVLLVNTGSSWAVGRFSLAQLGLAGSTAQAYNIWGSKTQTVTQIAYGLGGDAVALFEVK